MNRGPPSPRSGAHGDIVNVLWRYTGKEAGETPVDALVEKLDARLGNNILDLPTYLPHT